MQLRDSRAHQRGHRPGGALRWSNLAAAATFAVGAVGLATMFRVGVVATVLTSIVVIVLSTILVRALQAFAGG